MTTAEKAEAILKKITQLCNEGKAVSFEGDMGDNTLTIILTSQQKAETTGSKHTHVGCPGEDGTFELLVDNLYNSLHGGPGLSWV
jgi:hypothetical protein